MTDEHLAVAQIGNFDPPHSTENELRKALLACGHVVDPFQEGDRRAWMRLAQRLQRGPRPDFILWTRTASELNRIPVDLQERVVHMARDQGIPVVGMHLDIWWGLARSSELGSVPYFRLVDVMCTADGGHQDEWAAIGIDHRWFPPAVSEFECVPIASRVDFWQQVGFVGSWQGGYHREWAHRHALVDHLRRRGDVEMWPRVGEHALRGEDLRALYASVPVFVGDSCDVDRRGRYCSDRIPECLGRGGFLIHPRTFGVTDGSLWALELDPDGDGSATLIETPMFTEGEHLACWDIGEWDALDSLIDRAVKDPEWRSQIAAQGRAHVLAHHTYTQRIGVLVDMLRHEGRLP